MRGAAASRIFRISFSVSLRGLQARGNLPEHIPVEWMVDY